MSDDRPSIAELQAAIAPPHGIPPARLTDAELTIQHAGYHDFNAIESMAVELRQHRSHAVLVDAAPVLLEIAAAALAWNEARDFWLVAPTGPSKARFTDAATALADVVAKVRR